MSFLTIRDPREGKSTDAGYRDGAVRSRDEGSVMELDRRGCGIPPRTGGQPVTGGATWPRQSCWTTKLTAGYWEPDEPRGSRPVLRERGGETPPRHSPEIRSEEHTSELQSLRHLVCRLLLEKKKKRP